MPSNLLEEAIVDAEALREAALKSAQAAVLERYAPDVKKAIQVILEQEVIPLEEAEDDPLAGLESDSLPSPGGSSSPPGEAPDPLANAGGSGLSTITDPENGPDPSSAMKKLPMAATESEKLCACPDEDEEIEINFDELEQQMAATQHHDDIPDGMGGSDTSEEQSPDIKLNVNEEIEIDESLLSALLEGDLQEEVQEESEELEEDYDVVDGGGVYEESVQDLEEGGKGSLSAQHRGLDYGNRSDDKYDGPKNTKDAKRTASKIVRRQGKEDVKQRQSELNESQGFSQNNTLFKENKQLLQVRKELQDENKKIRNAVHELTKRLDEVNLSNARLVEINKALTSNSLNERQKSKVVEAISKAKSVEEVSVIHETLQQAVGSGKKKSDPKSLNEAVENKSGLRFTNREPDKKANPVYNRMQTLAGIGSKK